MRRPAHVHVAAHAQGAPRVQSRRGTDAMGNSAGRLSMVFYTRPHLSVVCTLRAPCGSQVKFFKQQMKARIEEVEALRERQQQRRHQVDERHLFLSDVPSEPPQDQYQYSSTPTLSQPDTYCHALAADSHQPSTEAAQYAMPRPSPAPSVTPGRPTHRTASHVPMHCPIAISSEVEPAEKPRLATAGSFENVAPEPAVPDALVQRLPDELSSTPLPGPAPPSSQVAPAQHLATGEHGASTGAAGATAAAASAVVQSVPDAASAPFISSAYPICTTPTAPSLRTRHSATGAQLLLPTPRLPTVPESPTDSCWSVSLQSSTPQDAQRPSDASLHHDQAHMAQLPSGPLAMPQPPPSTPEMPLTQSPKGPQATPQPPLPTPLSLIHI